MKPSQSIILSQPTSTTLGISVSRSNRLYAASAISGALALGYSFVFKTPVSDWPPHFWVFAILPVFGVPYVWRLWRMAMHGQDWLFDQPSGTMRGKNQEVPFAQITAVKIVTDPGEGSHVHRLSLDLESGKTIDMGNSEDFNYLHEMAERLGKFIGKPVQGQK